jgi:hypothetical protein
MQKYVTEFAQGPLVFFLSHGKLGVGQKSGPGSQGSILEMMGAVTALEQRRKVISPDFFFYATVVWTQSLMLAQRPLGPHSHIDLTSSYQGLLQGQLTMSMNKGLEKSREMPAAVVQVRVNLTSSMRWPKRQKMWLGFRLSFH